MLSFLTHFVFWFFQICQRAFDVISLPRSLSHSLFELFGFDLAATWTPYCANGSRKVYDGDDVASRRKQRYWLYGAQAGRGEGDENGIERKLFVSIVEGRACRRALGRYGRSASHRVGKLNADDIIGTRTRIRLSQNVLGGRFLCHFEVIGRACFTHREYVARRRGDECEREFNIIVSV